MIGSVFEKMRYFMKAQFSRRQILRLGAVGIGGLLAGGLPTLRTEAATNTPTLAEAMTSAAEAYLDTLDEAAKKQTSFASTDSERYRWHWTTPDRFPRAGVPLGQLSDSQKAAALALLQASTSAVGYQKALDIMALQAELDSDPSLYYFSVFGTPNLSTPWGWRVEGHHLSHHFTVVGQKVAVFPFFLGAWPTLSSKGLRAMPREEDAARELVNDLDSAQQSQAIFQGSTLTNHVTQNAHRVKPLPEVGIAYSDLNTGQQGLLQEIISTYLGVLPAAVADPALVRIEEADLNLVRFAWAGERAANRPHYYRLQGPTFLLEFDCSRNGGTHIHSVWRDFEQDFGVYLLP
jgi:hypothetical protein